MDPAADRPDGPMPPSRLPAPVPPLAGLSDEVVHLRPWTSADAPALAAAWNDDEIARRLPVPEDRTVEAASRWIAGWEQRRRWGLAVDLVICERPGQEVAGEIGLSRIDPVRRAALIGWWVAAERRGRGLATRAVPLVARWAVGSGWLTTLVAEIDPGNVASQRLAARCKFRPLGSRSDRGAAGRPSGSRVHVLTGPLG